MVAVLLELLAGGGDAAVVVRVEDLLEGGQFAGGGLVLGEGGGAEVGEEELG